MKTLSEEQATKALKKLDYGKLITHYFPLDVLENNSDQLKGYWWRISKYQKLSEQFIRKFTNQLNWELVSRYQTLSEDFIEEFEDMVEWNYISCNQKLSEHFIEKFSDKVNWDLISKYQTLSEDFILKFHKKVEWKRIAEFQNISFDFVDEMWHLLILDLQHKKDCELIFSNKNKIVNQKVFFKKYDSIKRNSLPLAIQNVRFNESGLDLLIDRIKNYSSQYKFECLRNIMVYQKLSVAFCVKHEDVLPFQFLDENIVLSYKKIKEIEDTIKIIQKLA